MIKDRNGHIILNQDTKNNMTEQQDKILRFLYTTKTGTIILKFVN